VDDFVKVHLQSVDGAAKLAQSKFLKTNQTSNVSHGTCPTVSIPETDLSHEVSVIPTKKKKVHISSVKPHNMTSLETVDRPTINSAKDIHSASTHPSSDVLCFACARGDLPTGAHKCVLCGRLVHLLEGCSLSMGDEEGYGEGRVCVPCDKEKRQVQHSIAVEAPVNKRNTALFKKKPVNASRSASCPYCVQGDFSTCTHECISCHRPVHEVETCSISVGEEVGFGERRICVACQSVDMNEAFESRVLENWRNLAHSSPKKKTIILSNSSTRIATREYSISSQKESHRSCKKWKFFRLEGDTIEKWKLCFVKYLRF